MFRKIYNQSEQDLNTLAGQSVRFRSYCLIVVIITLPLLMWYMYNPHHEDLLVCNDLHDQVDYAQLLDFQIVEDVCENSNPFLLILVHSAPDHFHRRKSIRETWGRNTDNVKTVFLLGLDGSKDRSDLILESAQYKDLVQGSFIDTYRNLTYKHVMALKYTTYHCSMAKYVLKADDDVFVNIQGLLTLLTANFSTPDDLIFCKTKEISPVNRSPNYKWAVTVEEYPGDYFPRYCWGFAVVYTPKAMSTLYRAALRTGFFWVDDIHVTGTLAEISRLNQTDASRYVITNWGEIVNSPNGGPQVDRKLLFGFDLAEETVRRLWKCYA